MNMKISDTKNIYLLQPSFWIKAWKRAAQKSSFHIKNPNQKQWNNFWNRISNIYQTRSQAEKPLVEQVIKLMVQEALLNSAHTVLDIGCGPGTYSIPLSKKVRKIVAVDSSIEMIKCLTKEMHKKNIANILPLYKKWEQCSYWKCFDLVFAAFSPAVWNPEGLTKMNTASRRYACILAASNNDFYIQTRNELWKEVTGKEFFSYAYNIMYPFNYLYTMGYKPSLRLIRKKISYREPAEHFIVQYEEYFTMFMQMTKKTKDIIRRYFHDRSKAGLFGNNIMREIYFMWWKTC